MRERLVHVRAQIADACREVGRSPSEITLIGVSKTHPPQDVLEAAAAGLVDFGENRPEEAVPKIAAVDSLLPGANLRWHMIGHIQRRKARLVVSRFALTHSVDSHKLAAKLSRLAKDNHTVLEVLLEINISGEESKSGFVAAQWDNSASVRESLWNDIQSMLKMPGLRVHGLMTMAPIVPDMEQTRPVFAGLRFLRDALAEAFPSADWSHLSMGMTDDFPVAISEGATHLRIGRAIFGPRVVR